MWIEPLTARAEEAGEYAFDVIVADAAGRDVARVRCAINAAAACGVFGEMELLDATGTARQRLRALVLLIRESLRHGDAIGITNVSAETPPALAALVARISGMTPYPHGSRSRVRGDLHAVRTRALDATTATGDVVDAVTETLESPTASGDEPER